MSFFDSYAMDHKDDDDLQSFCGSIEEPPFALVETEPPAALEEQAAPFASQLSKSGPLGNFLMNKMTDLISPSGSQETEKTTAMGSSILYSPMSQGSHIMERSSHNDHMDEDFEFDAAASLLAESPMLGRSSHFMERSVEPTSRPDDSMAFSDLMHEADDQVNRRQQPQSKLPSLPEDREMRSTSTSSSSVLTPRMTNRSLLGLFGSNDFSSTGTTRAGVNRLFQKRGIESTRIDQDSFEVSMYIYNYACSVQDIMDVIGNPDLLRLWCEPVRTLVVTRSSEGSRSAMNRREPGTDREYDGEWVEATTSTLSTPQKHSSTVYQLGQYLWSHLGFPSYGKITMFVERRRGKVGLTMGPFAGDMTAFHTLSVIEGDGFVKIVDRVRVSRDEEEHSSVVCCCGLRDAMQRCFMPSQLDGHVEQSMASMTRLRVMIENGESALMDYDSPPDLIVEGEEEGVSRMPLLS